MKGQRLNESNNIIHRNAPTRKSRNIQGDIMPIRAICKCNHGLRRLVSSIRRGNYKSKERRTSTMSQNINPSISKRSSTRWIICAVLILLFPSNNIENSYMIVNPSYQTFQEFKQKEDNRKQLINLTKKAMTQKLRSKTTTKKRQILTKLFNEKQLRRIEND